jgi:hypothetical protein
MSTDVMKLALAYVGQLARSYGPESEAYSVAEALSQAIEQAEQAQPVAHCEGVWWDETATVPDLVWDASAPLVINPHPAFQNVPPQRQPEQAQPVAHCEAGPEHCGQCLKESMPITSRRQWVGLTEDEIETLADPYQQNYVFVYERYARAIEQALKEKNT